MERYFPDTSRTRPPMSNRFSMFERWRNVGSQSYVLGNSISSLHRMSVGLVVVDPQFDLERYDESDNTTRVAKHEKESLCGDGDTRSPPANDYAVSSNPFEDPSEITQQDDAGVARNPFDDSNAMSRQSEKAPRQKLELEQPYHVFTKGQKWSVVIIIGVAGLFSGLSSNIYFPSLNQIAQDLHVSLSSVSLTITSYLIVQGISPVIWGVFSDALGRRPIYIASFTVYIIANVALSFSPNFAVLLIFRGLQAAGSASTVSIGNGVIQDISPPAERGAFISFYQAIRNFSIAIGPVLGGALSNFLGFRSIFIFLLILSSLVILVIIIFLPETMRRLAGNGSLRLKGVYQPLIYKLRGEPDNLQDPEDTVSKKEITLRLFMDPLKLLTQKEIVLNLIFGGVVYAIWSMVTSSTTGLFQSNFQLNETLLGLAFLPNGLGTIIGSTIIGQLMTRDYKAAETTYKIEHNLPPDYKLPAKNLPVDFPIEKARQRNLSWITILFIFATGIYGFSLSSRNLTSKPGWIVVPLLLQFLIAATSNAVFAMNQTLISDLCPGKGASGTAVNNLVRCGLGALGVAFVETLIAAMGPGPTFLGLALVTVISGPLAVMSWVWGMEWRAKRARQKDQVAEKV